MSKSILSLGLSALSLLSGVQASSYSYSYINYTTVTGFFLQDQASTVASTFDYTATNFGLINQTYDTDSAYDPTGSLTQWQRFEHKVATLNAAAASNVDYKILYIGRHGEGYHNVAQTYYGTPAWNCYWSELDGNGTITWSDAHITPNGVAQAQIANNFWTSQISTQKQSLPESYYVSPLTRCLETVNITFSSLTEKVPTVKELFRENISQHTCDRRSNRTYIEESFPTYAIEAGFTEDDELWRGVSAEPSTDNDIRSKTVLDEVFSADGNTFLSITTHSGEASSLLRVLGHQAFSLGTGAVIPVLVKAETISGSAPYTSSITWDAAATCTVPPITSLATGGCVCPSATSSSTSPASTNATITSTGSIATNTSVIPTISAGTSTATFISSTAPYGNSSWIASASSPTGTPSSPIISTSSIGATGSSPVTSSVPLTTSVVYTTQVITVTSCAPTVTNCPARSTAVITSTIALYTTTCPVSEATSSVEAVSSVSTSAVSPQGTSISKSSSSSVTAAPAVSSPESTTSTVYKTSVYTITSCAATITDCPAKIGQTTTEVVIDYTTVCPVTATKTESSSSVSTSAVSPHGSSVAESGSSLAGSTSTAELTTHSTIHIVITLGSTATTYITSSKASTVTVIPEENSASAPAVSVKTAIEATSALPTSETSSTQTSGSSEAKSASSPSVILSSPIQATSSVLGITSTPVKLSTVTILPTAPYGTKNSTTAKASGSGVISTSKTQTILTTSKSAATTFTSGPEATSPAIVSTGDATKLKSSFAGFVGLLIALLFSF